MSSGFLLLQNLLAVKSGLKFNFIIGKLLNKESVKFSYQISHSTDLNIWFLKNMLLKAPWYIKYSYFVIICNMKQNRISL